MDHRSGLPGMEFNPNYKTDKHTFKMMCLMVQNAEGTNSVLGMRDKYGTIGLYPRFKQPCQGGEMRRYKNDSFGVELHGAKCTRPESERPSDLYAPFPDGIPVLVGVKKPIPTIVWDTLFADNSPWKCGFGGRNDLHPIMNGDDIIGLVFKNTKVDPTALVNSIQLIPHFSQAERAFKKLIEAGATSAEALLISHLTYENYLTEKTVFKTIASGYHLDTAINIVNFIEGIPDPTISEGTMFDGYDYNRVRVSQLFSPKRGETPLNLKKECESRGLVDPKIVDMIDVVRDVYRIEKEKQAEKVAA